MLGLWIALAGGAVAAAVIGAALIMRRAWLALPAPSTFAEGQRALYGQLAAAGGMFCGLMALAMIALLTWGGWSKAEEHTIVIILGGCLGGFIVAMIAVIIGLLAGGPVGRFKVDGEIAGQHIGLEAGHDGTAP